VSREIQWCDLDADYAGAWQDILADARARAETGHRAEWHRCRRAARKVMGLETDSDERMLLAAQNDPRTAAQLAQQCLSLYFADLDRKPGRRRVLLGEEG
jgi:hypothetical protein